MSDLLTTGGVLAAFFAGGVALFAPCCIVFLAPGYLAAAVKNRRLRLLPLTFAFAAGLAMVLVPITLGISLVAATLARYHAPLYYAGGTLLLLLAALALSGRMWSLPSFLRTPDTARGDSASFFALGVFSGVASSCCAPVLAGVMTLSALSGSAAGGVALGLAYVLGMTFPLFLMALGWDRLRLGRRRWTRVWTVRLRMGAGCMSCFYQMAEFERHADDIVRAGITILPIVVNGAQETRRDMATAGVRTPFLLDADKSVSRAYGTLDRGMHPGLPGHSFVLIDRDGMQRWYGEYPSMYLSTADLLQQVGQHLD